MQLTGLKGLSAWLVYNKVVFSLIFLRRFNEKHNEQLSIIDSFLDCETLEDYREVAGKLTINKTEKVFYTQAEALAIFKESSSQAKEEMLFEALTVLALDDEEALRLLCLHKDANGVTYTKANIKSLNTADIVPLMIKSLIACADLNVDFSLVGEDELETLGNKRMNINDEANKILAKNPNISTGELLAMAVKSFFGRLKGNDNT